MIVLMMRMTGSYTWGKIVVRLGPSAAGCAENDPREEQRDGDPHHDFGP